MRVFKVTLSYINFLPAFRGASHFVIEEHSKIAFDNQILLLTLLFDNLKLIYLAVTCGKFVMCDFFINRFI